MRGFALALLRFSETRGREAGGIAVHDGQRIEVLKQGGSVTDFLANPQARTSCSTARSRAASQHGARDHRSLAARDERRAENVDNNQPVITRGSVALHNGIIVNDRELVARYPRSRRSGELDSEVLAALLRTKLDETKRPRRRDARDVRARSRARRRSR